MGECLTTDTLNSTHSKNLSMMPLDLAKMDAWSLYSTLVRALGPLTYAQNLKNERVGPVLIQHAGLYDCLVRNLDFQMTIPKWAAIAVPHCDVAGEFAARAGSSSKWPRGLGLHCQGCFNTFEM